MSIYLCADQLFSSKRLCTFLFPYSQLQRWKMSAHSALCSSRVNFLELRGCCILEPFRFWLGSTGLPRLGSKCFKKENNRSCKYNIFRSSFKCLFPLILYRDSYFLLHTRPLRVCGLPAFVVFYSVAARAPRLRCLQFLRWLFKKRCMVGLRCRCGTTNGGKTTLSPFGAPKEVMLRRELLSAEIAFSRKAAKKRLGFWSVEWPVFMSIFGHSLQ